LSEAQDKINKIKAALDQIQNEIMEMKKILSKGEKP